MMIRSLFLAGSVSLAALMPAPAARAQGDVPSPMATLQQPGAVQMMASAIGEVPVFDADGVQVGDAEGIVIGYDGAVAAVVVGVGGMLGVLERPVAVRFDHLVLSDDAQGNRRIDLDLTRAQLDAAPRFEKP